MNLRIDLLRELASAKHAMALTGAGISAESGVPTFRGADGLWSRLNPQELASFDAFLRNPDLVTEWYNHRREIANHAVPNGGHLALVQMETLFPDFTLVTQNIDNLHRRAGSKNVVELHGNIERNYCIECGKRYDGDAFEENESFKCPACGGLVRPDIVWFGEMLPADEWKRAEFAARKAEVIFVVGTSAVVYPAAELPVTVKQNGGKIIEVNIEATPLSSIADATLQGPASEILSDIVKQLMELQGIA